MEEMDWFQGRRFLTGVVMLMHRGKATLTCTPWEEWRVLAPTPFTLSCGNARERTITRRIGIEQAERESFEASLGATLGQKGIASLESAIKGQIGHEVRFLVGAEESEKFQFNSPACGRKTVRLYQLVRCIHLKYEDRRLWHKDAVDHTVTQWLPSIYDASFAEQYSPECNCDRSLEVKRQGGTPARIDAGILAKLAGFFQESGELLFGDGEVNLASHFDWRESGVKGQLPARMLPEYLRFLVGLEKDVVLEAAVWQEPILHPTIPETVPSSYVTLELDDNMELVEEALMYQHAGATTASAEDASDLLLRDQDE